MTDNSDWQKALQESQSTGYIAPSVEEYAKLKAETKESRWARKKARFSSKLGEKSETMKQGFKMGFMIGGGLGAALGTYQAIVTRSLLPIPLFVVTSGVSFGFFLSIGTIVRTEPASLEDIERRANNNENGVQMLSNAPLWVQRYAVFPQHDQE
eukprot:CAMPEP_0114994634 /NCGR_PEP_ID=MMETSP0216-20121206/13252_1 /TAXON_ID=223996 /ORGANISM="Protocruzia adherens, Strain Boccale" /LENGTH=153 /DNA_ID=CAMNT_0002358525 /DNA_START=29 /DNA_END=490 /DNA_ORIENTATION=+